MRLWLIGLGLIMGCRGKQSESGLFSSGIPLGTIDKKLEEASGLVASASNPGYFWTHNDSGDDASVYLINTEANVVMTCTLSNARNRDWEDITLGPGPEPGKNYLYVGDIGDNEARYAFKVIYRFEEPVLASDKVAITRFDTLFLQLSDGVRDAEALFIDPATAGLFVVSKREDSVRVYQIDRTWTSGDTITAPVKAKLPYFNTVAANVSPDGKEVLLKTYDKIYYWKRTGSEAIPDLLKTKPVELTYRPESQGEAIAWDREGAGFYTLSESNRRGRANLIFYKRN